MRATESKAGHLAGYGRLHLKRSASQPRDTGKTQSSNYRTSECRGADLCGWTEWAVCAEIG